MPNNEGHAMPFGAEVRGQSTRFRLYAPGAKRVELLLPGTHPERVPMEPVPGAPSSGWLEALVPDTGNGTRYAFEIDGDTQVADPASRFQPEGVHQPSEVIDPSSYRWKDDAWRGRPWHEAVLYEIHVGAFTPEGTFRALLERLDALHALGVTAIELMPVAECPGRRNWGYDGVLPFAPSARHGRPEDLKALVDAAHARGLMVFLDVVYNHFGPDGNYLRRYAPDFFTGERTTPWGEALAFERLAVREFFIHNALYWIEEFHLDGLRLDAVHAIQDPSDPDVLTELAERVQGRAGASREVHLVLENDDNEARRLTRGPAGRPRHYTAQWSDDIHHTLHVLLTGERQGYYADYAQAPAEQLGRGLAEGFAYQGEASPHRGGRPRGEPSARLPATCFVNFLQNHDQVGNRALGERILTLASPEAVRAAVAVLLLAPSPPLLFMGEEWGARQPFLFFCDFDPDLGAKVRDGRRREFASFPAFRDAAAREQIPDPNAEATFAQSRLCWNDRDTSEGRDWLRTYATLLDLRAREIVPRLAGLEGGAGTWRVSERSLLEVRWRLGDGARLTLHAVLTGADPPHRDSSAGAPESASAPGRLLHATPNERAVQTQQPWSVGWWLEEPR